MLRSRLSWRRRDEVLSLKNEFVPPDGRGNVACMLVILKIALAVGSGFIFLALL